MAIDELSQLIHLPIGNVAGAPTPEDTPDEETISPRSLICLVPLIQPRRGLIGR